MRYSRNIPAITPGEQAVLENKRLLVLGCGGLGGCITENLLRMGVGHITAVDGDCFDESNLNRQLLSEEGKLGQNKALAAAERAGKINSRVHFRAVPAFFDRSNADELLEGCDLVLDGLDNVSGRLLLEEKCAEKGIAIVHGAVSGWCFQLSFVKAGSAVLSRLYADAAEGADKSALSPTVQLCAALQCAEALKYLCGRRPSLEGKLLLGDAENMFFEIIDF